MPKRERIDCGCLIEVHASGNAYVIELCEEHKVRYYEDPYEYRRQLHQSLGLEPPKPFSDIAEGDGMMWVDDKPLSNQRKRILDIWTDSFGIPERAELTRQTIKALDGTTKQLLKVPREWRNVFIKIDDQDISLKFDYEGYSYVEVKAKKCPNVVRVYFKDDFEKLLELLKDSIDFCDSCKYPLNVTERNRGLADEYLNYESGGAIAGIFICPFCDHENIRWERDFLEAHPELRDGLKLRKR